ncbi:putative inner membrane or exported protein [hydrothermal vent metagenome]|uniref:Putative inner membrane or exported protein n=1 Tax=hydrothermal vent metagenome TaxID=652676 RepID=A0A1W1ELJ4_9ZZZZ
MKKLYITLIASILLISCNSGKGSFVHTVDLNGSVAQNVAKLEKIIKKSGLVHFYNFDHKKSAKDVNLTLRDTTLVVFGNPYMGTKLIKCNQTMGIDLPLKMLIYETFEGETKMSYTNPEYYSSKHNIKDAKCLNIIKKATIALDAISFELKK